MRFYLLDGAGFRESLERRRHQNAEALSNQLFGSVAENARSGAVGGLNFSAAVHDNDAVGRRIDDGAEPLFTFAQRLLGAPAVGDVENEPIDTALARYGSHFGAQLDPADRPVSRPDAKFQSMRSVGFLDGSPDRLLNAWSVLGEDRGQYTLSKS